MEKLLYLSWKYTVLIAAESNYFRTLFIKLKKFLKRSYKKIHSFFPYFPFYSLLMLFYGSTLHVCSYREN
jgi:hypothetical protein